MKIFTSIAVLVIAATILTGCPKKATIVKEEAKAPVVDMKAEAEAKAKAEAEAKAKKKLKQRQRQGLRRKPEQRPRRKQRPKRRQKKPSGSKTFTSTLTCMKSRETIKRY